MNTSVLKQNRFSTIREKTEVHLRHAAIKIADPLLVTFNAFGVAVAQYENADSPLALTTGFMLLASASNWGWNRFVLGRNLKAVPFDNMIESSATRADFNSFCRWPNKRTAFLAAVTLLTGASLANLHNSHEPLHIPQKPASVPAKP
jgi:hypothetical protein